MHALLEPRPRAMGMGFVCTMRRPWNGLPHSCVYLLGRAGRSGLPGVLGTNVPSDDVMSTPSNSSNAAVFVQREGKPAGIEARADIRARGRNADFYHTAPLFRHPTRRVAHARAGGPRLGAQLRKTPACHAAQRKHTASPSEVSSISICWPNRSLCHRLGRVFQPDVMVRRRAVAVKGPSMGADSCQNRLSCIFTPFSARR